MHYMQRQNNFIFDSDSPKIPWNKDNQYHILSNEIKSAGQNCLEWTFIWRMGMLSYRRVLLFILVREPVRYRKMTLQQSFLKLMQGHFFMMKSNLNLCKYCVFENNLSAEK